MKILKPDNFINIDGFTFEDLIVHVLKEEYGEIFTHTGYTNDGGKDFATDSNILYGSRVWAECKKYRMPLSYNDISTTLLMAYIKEVNKILIFSFSPVNRRFYKKIAEYTQKSGINVEVFADEELENLLLKYRNRKWFSDYISLDNIPAEYAISKQANLMEYRFEIPAEYKKNIDKNRINVNINEVFVLHILIINKCSEDQEVEIDLSDFGNYESMELLDQDIHKGKTKQVVIQKHTAQLIELHIRIAKFQEIYRLPTITINGIKLRVRQRIYTTWLAETILSGTEYEKHFSGIMQYLQSPVKLNFVFLEGDSGTGKSRIMRELCQNAVQLQYKSFYCDIDKKKISIRDLCQELFAFFTNLPFFNLNRKRTLEYLSTQPHNEILRIGVDILYNRDFQIHDHLDRISKCIFKILQNDKFLILIDNIQKFDNDTIQLFENLIALSSNQKCASAIVLAFNTNYIAASKRAHELLQHLIYLSNQKPERYYEVKLREFEDESASDYIKNCLEINRFSDSKYDKLIKKIINKVGYNALALRSFLIWMHKNDYIQVRNNCVYVKNFDVLFDKNSVSEYSLAIILSQLENTMMESIDKEQERTYYNIIGTLNLIKSVPNTLLRKIAGDNVVIECLSQYGMIELDRNTEAYSYKHREIRQYFVDKYGFNYMECLLVLNQLLRSLYKKAFICEIFLMQLHESIINQSVVCQVKKKIIDDEIDYDNLEIIYNGILTLYINRLVEPSLDDINLLQIMGNISTNFIGVRKSLKLYSIINAIIIQNMSLYEEKATEVIEIFKEYLRHLMNEGQTTDALRENEKFKKRVFEMVTDKNQILFIPELLKMDILIYYKLGYIEKALSIGNRLKSIYTPEDISYAETEMFIGNIFYYTADRFENKEKVIERWENAYDSLQEEWDNYDLLNWNVKSIMLNCYIKKTLVSILKNEKESAPSSIQIKKIINHTGMVYFEIKIRHLMILEYLMERPSSISGKESLAYAEECLDILCTKYGNKSLYAITFFLVAEIYMCNNDFDKMYDYFLNFYNIFTQIYYKNEEKNNDYLLIEMIYNLRRFKEKLAYTFNENLLKSIVNQELSRKLLKILHMNDDEFRLYFKNNAQLSLFYNPHKHINLPLI